MGRLKLNNQLVSVSDLMQITHPGHKFLISNYDIKENDLPMFLDYCVVVYGRFKHYAENNNNLQISDKSLYDIMQDLKKMRETDEPSEIHVLRQSLKGGLMEFRKICKSMSACFSSPLVVKSFYDALGDRLTEQIVIYAGIEYE
tara:strand:+ start:6591 stop:7022 length:432 start_codon:yes stop_codon:yes gene_type:complete